MVYLDDIIITSNSVEEHVEHLTQVFTLLQQAGLRVKLEKCSFGRKEIKYLGFKLTQEGVKLDNSKTEAVETVAPVPVIQRKLRGFYVWHRGINSLFQILWNSQSLCFN